MNIKNRYAITINYKKPFIDWTNTLTPELQLSENAQLEATTYLVKGDFDDHDYCIRKNFKKIFELELEGQWLDENDWPEPLSFEVFEEWFTYKISYLVIDLK